MIVWVILVVLIFGAGFGAIFMALKKRHAAAGDQMTKNIELIGGEIERKKELLSVLAKLSLGLTPADRFTELEESLRSVEEELRAERGRLTITEAELEAVDTRLRELEELKRELEMSGLDAVRELELLRAQERDIANQNEVLKTQLDSALDQLDMLLDMLASSAAAVSRLNGAKGELVEAEKKSNWYQE